MSSAEILMALFWKAADKDAAFAQYLYKNIKERMESGRSMDCDEYRALLGLADQRGRDTGSRIEALPEGCSG